MKVKLTVGIIVLVVVGFIGVNIFIYTNEKQTAKATGSDSAQKTYAVEEKILNDMINVKGKVSPSEEEFISFDESKGKIKEILVKEGDAVKAGSNIVVYQSDELNQQIEQANIAKSRALIQLEQLKHQEEMVSEKIADAEKSKATEVIAQLKEEQKTFSFQRRTANLDYEEAESTIKNLEKKVNEQVIKSPIDGVISKINSDVQTTIGNNLPLLQITSKDSYIVSGILTEFDFPFLNVGDKVNVKAKAVPDELFSGVISSIDSVPQMMNNDPQLSTESQTASYPFQVDLTGSIEALKPGYEVNVEVEVKGEVKKPVVPVESIATDDKGEFVFVVVDDTLKKQYIETGLLDQGYKEILDGLKINDEILLNPSSDSTEGLEINN